MEEPACSLFIVKAPPRGRLQQQQDQLTLQVVLDVPRLVGMPDVSLEVSKTCLLRFSVPELYRLQMQLPFTVAGNASVAKFSKRKRQLSVFLPLRLEDGRLQIRLNSKQGKQSYQEARGEHCNPCSVGNRHQWKTNLLQRLCRTPSPNGKEGCEQG
jgi:hypothetical protein